ncbi:MAG: phosphoenolpyruvate carboxykinase (GTP) [Gammaproteobacteria bacterium]|nr:phosphoenolpyruvate carboxykinase (GTP) [Gammaproteobacteria bacterium]MCP5201827.1 phosphoenolpyruvate carboxykinase (GTP) [Gammaproteobacteria bacterium]
MTKNAELAAWVEQVAALTQPERIQWCDGSDAENASLIDLMLAQGDLLRLNPETHPNCFLHRSDPKDVARVEHLTFVCTEDAEDAGPNNNWLAPAEAHAKVDPLFEGCMRGRTMYVVPYLMGPYGSPYARAGVEVTDSPYVVANMRIMARIGTRALEHIEAGNSFVRGLHSTGDLDPERRFIMHFPDELLIMSIGSGYGGNALLGKKCHALRIASAQARREGWLAEHMLILGIESPAGETRYIAAAFPSACGKTNLAMLVPPAEFAGWKVWTVGDDIAWMHLAEDGQLWAINPEAGFFGVAPGTSLKTNPNCMNTLGRNAIYTNVAVTEDLQPWWEGIDGDKPAVLIDWQGRPHDPDNGPAAHPNARFTVAASQCPSFSPQGEAPQGVPISAIVFGGRRSSVAPLVFEALDWSHGVFAGAAMASETTAAATGKVGQVRRDPMAMKPFCGYNFGDYWAHWLGFGTRSAKLPRIFHVNWFRKDADGKFIWPGFGDNMRVMAWILARCDGKAEAIKTPIGFVPEPSDLKLDGLDLDRKAIQDLLSIDPQVWQQEVDQIEEYFASFGSRLPQGLRDQVARIKAALEAQLAA